MDEADFEGTLVLEKLALIGEVDAFFDAVDEDDFERARSLMKRAGVASDAVSIVLKMMSGETGGDQ